MPNQQTNTIEKPLIYGSNKPVVVTEPIRSPDYSNYIDRAYSMLDRKMSEITTENEEGNVDSKRDVKNVYGS